MRRDLIADRFDALDGVTCPRPDGAFYVFPDVRGLIGRSDLEDDVALCAYLLDEAKVAAVPGTGFGTPGYVRFSYTLPDARLEEAITRVEQAVAKLA